MPSISKTKSGERFRAPTDQARKMDRKKENKRNKKDRQQIRQAMAKYCNLDETTSKLLVLERQILGLDPQPFHIDVLKKKQKVLQDSINKRRLTLQQSKDEAELKKFNEKMSAYQQDCNRLYSLAQSARLAREVDPDAIPLPMGEASASGPERHSQLLAPSMIKRKVEFQLPPRPPRAGMKPPGPPCGTAPTFSDSEEEDHNDHDHYDDGDLAPVPIPDFDNSYAQMHRSCK
uniref:Wbp11/ELF5/Saf1 N-terminal domain-containing protein n=1 Tax=Caenorhabditis japonica TaxID=281687 RepID=A0A8R1HQS1_CAEJA